MNSDFQLPESILKKIEKLLALADPTSGATLEEANNASAKVQDILAKYNLELSQLQLGKKEPIEVIAYIGCWDKWLGKNDGLWVKYLAQSVTLLNGVSLINHSAGQLKHLQKFTLIGKKH
uniref:DUF2786 domain-containing protein n=1 Tax=Flavobacterium sp. TaxID=239 RepID=UPI0037C12969